MTIATRLLTRATLGWLLLLLLAVLNGAFRQALLIPRIGESAGHIWILVPITTLLAPVMVRVMQSSRPHV